MMFAQKRVNPCSNSSFPGTEELLIIVTGRTQRGSKKSLPSIIMTNLIMSRFWMKFAPFALLRKTKQDM
ncbi:hypothetical protein PMSD_01890 [Paenibacillus macquariensis subsp. defensor]|nr:hypothetical protein PMSD_01890 [Paenibacillus macquariensis subsp. defensor]